MMSMLTNPPTRIEPTVVTAATEVLTQAGPSQADERPIGPAIVEARCLVGEYLRDSGLRDPVMIARFSQKIVSAAASRLEMNQSAPGQMASEEACRRLNRLAIGLAVDLTERKGDGVRTRPGRERPVRPANDSGPSDSSRQTVGATGLSAPVIPRSRPQAMRRPIRTRLWWPLERHSWRQMLKRLSLRWLWPSMLEVRQ